MSAALVQQVKHLPQQQQEMAVSMYLEQAKERLTEALHRTGPETVASIKAEVATAAEATKQLGLSKEIRDDAAEMVRRAEYTLGKAIRKGQDEGTVARKGARPNGISPHERNGHPVAGHIPDPNLSSLPSPTSFVSGDQERTEIYAMSDGVTEEEFEEVLTEAREEGSVSRANIVRKVKDQQSGQTRKQRADLIADLAQQGYSSRQMPAKVGITEQAIKLIARDFDIDIHADRVIGKSRRIDSNRVLSNVAETVETAAYSLQQIDPLDLDQEAAQEWVDSLTESIKALRKALNPIKESLHD